MKFNFGLIILSIFVSITSYSSSLETKNVELFDAGRNRAIPVVMYKNAKLEKLPVIIINHGYGAKNSEYSIIANALAKLGYFVVSIQHDLETDKPLPRIGNLYKKRKPLWERGVENILFVIAELKKTNTDLNLDKVILIGHSNGGDISMMFADKYHKKVSKIISLDSLRYPFSSENGLPILHFRASDTKADSGVIKDKEVETIIIEGVKHIDLCDRGGQRINKEILKSIMEFLNK